MPYGVILTKDGAFVLNSFGLVGGRRNRGGRGDRGGGYEHESDQHLSGTETKYRVKQTRPTWYESSDIRSL